MGDCAGCCFRQTWRDFRRGTIKLSKTVNPLESSTGSDIHGCAKISSNIIRDEGWICRHWRICKVDYLMMLMLRDTKRLSALPGLCSRERVWTENGFQLNKFARLARMEYPHKPCRRGGFLKTRPWQMVHGTGLDVSIQEVHRLGYLQIRKEKWSRDIHPRCVVAKKVLL